MSLNQCKMMVSTQPKVGDIERHPPPHQCKRPIYADGYCATHSARYQEEKRIKVEMRDRRYAAPIEKRINEIDQAIALLVNNGYRVEKVVA